MDRLYFNDGELYALDEEDVDVTALEIRASEEAVALAKLAVAPVNFDTPYAAVLITPANARRIISYLTYLLDNWSEKKNG